MAPTPMPPIDIRSRAGQYVERTDGLHFSQIMNDILVTLEPDRYGQGNEGKWMNFLVGLIFERALELAWLDREIEGNYRPELIRPGEVTYDGVFDCLLPHCEVCGGIGKKGIRYRILGTPDAYDTYLARPEEYKCSKKSCRQDITDKKFWHYWVQLKAYAFITGSHSGVLYILHVMGNWSRDDNDPENGYVIKGWEDTWTDLELLENWNMIIKHAHSRRLIVWTDPALAA